MENLNFDIMNNIYNNLNYIDIINISSTNKYFHKMLKENNKYIYSNNHKYITINDHYLVAINKNKYDNKIIILNNIISIFPNIKIRLYGDCEFYENKVKILYNKYKLNIITLDISNNYNLQMYNFELFLDIPHITISFCNIKTLIIHNNLNNITNLYLCGNIINNIDFLKYIKNIKNLYLQGNNINNLLIFDNKFTNIELLDLSLNDLNNIDSLYNLTTLTFLNLSYNNIENIKSLYKLTNLKELLLSNNKITNIDGIDCLINLKYLDLLDNFIQTNYNIITNLPLLQCLKLNDDDKLLEIDDYLKSGKLLHFKKY